jgi:hypothetical protein
MPREGQLLQVDGRRRRWFGPDLPSTTLVAGIDDATSQVPGGTFRARSRDRHGSLPLLPADTLEVLHPSTTSSSVARDVLARRIEQTCGRGWGPF